VAAQTERDLQLIVTDDASTDASRRRISRWIHRHGGRSELVASDRNVGLPAMQNLALPRVEGRYVVVMGADDWMEPDRVSLQADCLDRVGAHVGLVYSDLRVVDESGVPTGDIFPGPEVERREGQVLHHLIARPMIGMGCVMVRREVLDAIGPWDESLVAEDFDFLLRVAAVSEFAYLPAIALNYRQHGASMTAARSAELTDGRVRALRKQMGIDRATDRLVLRRMEDQVVALHGYGYRPKSTRSAMLYVFRRAPSRRLVRVWVESRLGLPPRALARTR